MSTKIKILLFLIILFFCVNKVNAVGELTYLNVFLRGDCFLTVKLPDNTIAGMDFEKGHATVPPRAVYSGLYMEPQYLIFVNPDAGSYYVTIVSRNEGICELEVQLIKGSNITFSKTLSENLKKGESREAAFTLYKFGTYDVTYQIWNIAPGSGKEALSEGFHKPYLEIIPNFIKIGLLAEKNQEIPIIIKTPHCVPPTGVSCSIIPAENVTFSLHEIPKDFATFSENGFSVEANSSKDIKFKVKIPEIVEQFGGYIYVKSSIGNNIIFVEANLGGITETEPIIELPIISFDVEKTVAKFMKISKNTKGEIEMPKEVDLPVSNIKFQTINDLQNFKIITNSLKENELINRNIPEINKKTYGYIEIIKEDISDKDITNIQIEFKVSKNWIRENKINVNRVKLFRFTGDGWEGLETEKILEDSESVYYKAFTSNLSIFAITGEIEEEKKEVSPGVSEVEEATKRGEKGITTSIIFWIIGAVAFLSIIGVFVYVFLKKKKVSRGF